MLNIIRAGICTSIQDDGRSGWRQYGISEGGSLDNPAMQTANMLVGNEANAAVLEITLGQFTAEFACDGWIALTGAGCRARLDGQIVWTGWRTAVKKGQLLVLNIPLYGMRSYLAVSGGFALEPTLGSCSTDLNAGFGGLKGRKLKDGDCIPLAGAGRGFTKAVGVRQLLWGNRVRALPGPEYHEFNRESQEVFWRTAWRLDPQSNRMGYRLQGQELHREICRELLSHGLVPGMVQVPASGMPIVLLADAQTTGGYPRIACVIEADLHHLAQLRLGEPVHFVCCTPEEALSAKWQQQQALNKIAWGLADENRS